jgi:hypothetical protein
LSILAEAGLKHRFPETRLREKAQRQRRDGNFSRGPKESLTAIV